MTGWRPAPDIHGDPFWGPFLAGWRQVVPRVLAGDDVFARPAPPGPDLYRVYAEYRAGAAAVDLARRHGVSRDRICRIIAAIAQREAGGGTEGAGK